MRLIRFDLFPRIQRLFTWPLALGTFYFMLAFVFITFQCFLISGLGRTNIDLHQCNIQPVKMTVDVALVWGGSIPQGEHFSPTSFRSIVVRGHS